MKTIDRKYVHSFFRKMIAGNPAEEQVAILLDILVDDFCFLGAEKPKIVLKYNELEEEILKDLKPNPMVNKIHCIRRVREETGMGLVEAKTFVEHLMAGKSACEELGINPQDSTQKPFEQQILGNLEEKLKRVAERYNIK